MQCGQERCDDFLASCKLWMAQGGAELAWLLCPTLLEWLTILFQALPHLCFGHLCLEPIALARQLTS